MKIKKGVIMAGLQLPMRRVLMEAELLWKTAGKELVVTSALEGTHMAGSYHYYGYALDFRTHYFTKEKALELVRALRFVLSDQYTVVWHSTHIHVQYNASQE